MVVVVVRGRRGVVHGRESQVPATEFRGLVPGGCRGVTLVQVRVRRGVPVTPSTVLLLLQVRGQRRCVLLRLLHVVVVVVVMITRVRMNNAVGGVRGYRGGGGTTEPFAPVRVTGRRRRSGHHQLRVQFHVSRRLAAARFEQRPHVVVALVPPWFRLGQRAYLARDRCGRVVVVVVGRRAAFHRRTGNGHVLQRIVHVLPILHVFVKLARLAAGRRLVGRHRQRRRRDICRVFGPRRQRRRRQELFGRVLQRRRGGRVNAVAAFVVVRRSAASAGQQYDGDQCGQKQQ